MLENLHRHILVFLGLVLIIALLWLAALRRSWRERRQKEAAAPCPAAEGEGGPPATTLQTAKPERTTGERRP